MTMMYGSQDIKMEKIENQIFSVVQGTSSGLKLTLIINHLEVKILSAHKKPAVKLLAIVKLAAMRLYGWYDQSDLVSCLKLTKQ